MNKIYNIALPNNDGTNTVTKVVLPTELVESNRIVDSSALYAVDTMEMHVLLSMLTYQRYAKLCRQLDIAGLNRRPTFDEYYSAIDVQMLKSVDSAAWRGAYELTVHMYEENERQFEANIEMVIGIVNN